MTNNTPIQVVINGNAGSGKTLVAAVIAEALRKHFADKKIEVLSLEGDLDSRLAAVVEQDDQAPFHLTTDTIQIIDACQNNQASVAAWAELGARLIVVNEGKPVEA